MVYGELGLLVSYVFITLCNSPWFDHDSIQFPADQPHGYSNPEESEAVLHFVMIYS